MYLEDPNGRVNRSGVVGVVKDDLFLRKIERGPGGVSEVWRKGIPTRVGLE